MAQQQIGTQQRTGGGMHWLGTTLIEIYESDAKEPAKIDLLEQIVSIVRREDRQDERVREIASLIRDWQQLRRVDASSADGRSSRF
jgi:hypothetical protein